MGISALAVCFAGVVALSVDATNCSRFRRVLEKRGLRTIGKYSYALYVFHFLILFWTVRLLSPLSHGPGWAAKIIVVICVSAMSFGMAWLSWHFYEKRFLQLKRFFEYGGRCDAMVGLAVYTPAERGGQNRVEPELS